MQRKLVIKTNNEAEVSAEELYELRRAAFQQWTDAGLHTSVTEIPIENRPGDGSLIC